MKGEPLERSPVDLVQVASDAVADFRVVAADRPIDFQGEGGLVVSGDQARLRQVTANLLGNARVHTPSGTPVHVRVGAAGRWAVLEVSDDGPGLTLEQSERVFERFYRADPSRSRASGGSGLGLSIVAAIAEAHGGAATVESVPGGTGTTFRVTVPLDDGDSGSQPTPQPAPGPTRAPRPKVR